MPHDAAPRAATPHLDSLSVAGSGPAIAVLHTPEHVGQFRHCGNRAPWVGFPEVGLIGSRSVVVHMSRMLAVLAFAATLVVATAAGAAGFATGIVTTSDFTTGEKPQSKLWLHDGSYWAVVQGPDGVAIYEKMLDTWQRCMFMDAVLTPEGHADVKWNGTDLFVLVYAASPSLFKYSYDATLRIWILASGFPVMLPRPSGAETMVLEQDSTGRLWATAEGLSAIHAYYSTSADHRAWSPDAIVLRNGVNTDDISTVIAFGGDRIGVFWSDQNRDEFGFRVHRDVDDPATWGDVEVVDSGLGFADDHLQVQADAQGRVFAITKDDYDRMQVHRRAAFGGWTTTRDMIAGTGTRGILQICDLENRVYALFTRWDITPNPIEYRTADLDSMQFGGNSNFMNTTYGLNNVTGTKQPLPAGHLMALATGGNRVWWNGWTPNSETRVRPASPTGVLAALRAGPTRVEIAWQAPAGTAPDGYHVYRQVDGGMPQRITNDLVTGLGCSDLWPPLGELCYHVVALASGLQSPVSPTACVQNQPIAPPGAPEALTATRIVPGTSQGTTVLWFDAGSGQLARDLSGNGNHANLGSTTMTDANDPVWVPGVGGMAVALDGKNDYLHASDAATFDMSGSFTVEAWVRRGASVKSCLGGKGFTGTRTFRISITKTGAVEFVWDNTSGAAQSVTSGNAVAVDGAWHHVACVYDALAGANRIYVDGTLRIAAPASGVPAINAKPLYIGARPASALADFFNGAIDEFRMAPAALYSANFTPIAASGGGPPEAIAGRQGVLLEWSAPTTGGAAAAYRIERSVDSGAPMALTPQLLTTTIFADDAAPEGALCYFVTALNAHDETGPTSQTCTGSGTPPPLPGTPLELHATLNADSVAQVRLAWRAAPDGGEVAGYHVFRTRGAEAAIQLTTNLVADTTWTDSTLVGGTLCYHVRGVGPDARLGAASDSVCITYTPPAMVGAPLAANVAAADTIVAGATNGAAAYVFDEGSGQSLADATANGNTGQLGSGTNSDSNDPSWVVGVAGSALRFDGSNDRARVPDAASLRIAGSFTLEAWVRRGSTGTTDCILSKGDTGSRNYSMMFDAAGKLDFTWETAGGTRHGATSLTSLTDSNWHHVACVYDRDASESRIYFDGRLDVRTADAGTPVATSAEPLYLGVRRVGGSFTSYFHGTMDLVRVSGWAVYGSNFTPPASYQGSENRHRLRVAWQAPTSGSAAGYHVYRRAEDDDFVRLTSTPITAMFYMDGAPLADESCYRVTAMDALGTEGPACEPVCAGSPPEKADEPELPAETTLSAGPNPFNPATTLRFALASATNVRLEIFNVRGERVTTLVQGTLPAGAHAIRWLGRSDAGVAAASGVYFARLRAGALQRHVKLLLVQ